MLYEETYQLGGDPNHQDVSIAIFDQSSLAEESRSGFPAHSHSFYEMDYTFDGYAEFEFDNRIVQVRPGTLLFFPPLFIHAIRVDRRDHNLTMQFSSRLLKNSIEEFGQDHMLVVGPGICQASSLPVGPVIDACVRQLVHCVPRLNIPFPENYRQISRCTPEEEMGQTGFLLLMLADLLKNGCLQIIDIEFKPDDISNMNRLLKQIIEHPESKISMEKAAEIVGMGYSNFSRAFKSAAGCSYVDFTNSMRCIRAKELLSQTELSVTEISMRLGFGSISYFNRIFKKFTGMTPLAYKANCTR